MLVGGLRFCSPLCTIGLQQLKKALTVMARELWCSEKDRLHLIAMSGVYKALVL